MGIFEKIEKLEKQKAAKQISFENFEGIPKEMTFSDSCWGGDGTTDLTLNIKDDGNTFVEIENYHIENPKENYVKTVSCYLDPKLLNKWADIFKNINYKSSNRIIADASSWEFTFTNQDGNKYCFHDDDIDDSLYPELRSCENEILDLARELLDKKL